MAEGAELRIGVRLVGIRRPSERMTHPIGRVISQSYSSRPCPACGAASNREEVSSRRRAEELPFEELRHLWSGLDKERVFFSYCRCETCGLLFAPIFFTPDQLSALYASMAPNMEMVPTASLAATQRCYFERVARTAAMEGGYLEIGPDVGFIVREAVTSGGFDHFWLFEPNRAVHDQLRDATAGNPHTISPDMDDLDIVPDGSIGVAVMIHVLDHLLDPFAMLTQIRRKLRPGGTLMIVTHNEASLLRKALGRRWPPFCLQHPELYGPDSMRSIMERAGYSVARIERSRNYFPADFLVRQAALAVGLNVAWLPLPKVRVGLKLGNILALARRPDIERAAETRPLPASLRLLPASLLPAQVAAEVGHLALPVL